MNDINQMLSFVGFFFGNIIVGLVLVFTFRELPIVAAESLETFLKEQSLSRRDEVLLRHRIGKWEPLLREVDRCILCILCGGGSYLLYLGQASQNSQHLDVACEDLSVACAMLFVAFVAMLRERRVFVTKFSAVTALCQAAADWRHR